MSQPTPVAIGTNAFGLPVLPGTRELYDLIMATIEPELVSTSLPELRKKYSDETPENGKKRAAQYAEAFKKYDASLQNYMAALHRAVKQYTHTAAKSFETMIRAGEENDLQNLENAFTLEPSTKSHDA